MNMWSVKTNIERRYRKKRVAQYGKDAIKDIYHFCLTAEEVRTAENCSQYYGGKYSVKVCEDVIQYLFDARKMGAYYFAKDEDPQRYMQEYIIKNFSEINRNSYIMEVGPGNNPLFLEGEYPNWYSCDINYKNGIINFSGKIWGKGMYQHIYEGGWENLSEVCATNMLPTKYDLVCGSHSFEHNHRPIRALNECAKVLKENGILVLFVPDGYSTWSGNYDKTHALYFTQEMVEDFFEATGGGYKDVCCKQFRKNMDLVITARKRTE